MGNYINSDNTSNEKIIKISNNIIIGEFDENSNIISGIKYKNKIYKIIFAISFSNYNMIDYHFDNKIRLVVQKNDNNEINFKLTNHNNITEEIKIKTSSLLNIPKINNSDIDMIFYLINDKN